MYYYKDLRGMPYVSASKMSRLVEISKEEYDAIVEKEQKKREELK